MASAGAPTADERGRGLPRSWHGQGTDQPDVGAAGISQTVSRAVNPRDNPEVLVCPRSRLAAHETIVAGALERNRRLLEHLGQDELAVLLGHLDRLTDTAAKMLAAEKELA